MCYSLSTLFFFSYSPHTHLDRGRDVVRGSLNWGPFTWLNGVSKTYGWWSTRRSTFSSGFHTYTLEWAPTFLRIYVDTRLHKTLELTFNKPFFERGEFPPYVANGSQTIATPDPWVDAQDGVVPGSTWKGGKGGGGNGKNAAPFDKPFYLIMNVAVGGTNGWFPDGVGGKPWLDGSHGECLVEFFVFDFASGSSSYRLFVPLFSGDVNIRTRPRRMVQDVA